ncbi:MAG: hypothetical protein AAGU75_16535 [Bacillota bacterium]
MTWRFKLNDVGIDLCIHFDSRLNSVRFVSSINGMNKTLILYYGKLVVEMKSGKEPNIK